MILTLVQVIQINNKQPRHHEGRLVIISIDIQHILNSNDLEGPWRRFGWEGFVMAIVEVVTTIVNRPRGGFSSA